MILRWLAQRLEDARQAFTARPIIKARKRIEIERILAFNRIHPALRLEHMHRLFMGNFAQRVDGKGFVAMVERGTVFGALSIDAGSISLHFQEHVPQPVAFCPGPVTLAIIDIFSGNIFKKVAGIKPVCGRATSSSK